ncbi:MAG TPA: hypothetical protein VJW20_24290 [Candidatus Angelobacter sp.]|nr:hypothetical protein [Candidatus Angelobacter sp.]
MTKLRLLTTRRCLIVGVLMLASNLWTQQRSPLLEKVAKAFGVDSWNQIEAIRYTWNGEITGLFKLSRTWEWEPKTNKVTYESKDKDGKPVKVTYMRSELGSQPDNVKNEIDPGFINDNYWLLFPFHAYWDTSAGVIDQGRFNVPTGSGEAELLSVKYPAGGGYRPGDTWDLYISKDNRVVYLDYHRGGATPPSRAFASWTAYKKAGPLLISTEHRGSADGKPLHVFLSDVAVKLTGSDKWIKAQ